MDTQWIKEENAALGRILTGDFYRIVWNITTPSYFSRKEANYSVHFSVIWKFFLVVSSRISTLYQRLPLIVEEFDFKFLIEITLTLSFFFVGNALPNGAKFKSCEFWDDQFASLSPLFPFQTIESPTPFRASSKTRREIRCVRSNAVIALKGHSRSLEYSSAFARVGRRCSSFPITLEELFRAGLEIKNLPENGEFIIISTHLNDEVLTE